MSTAESWPNLVTMFFDQAAHLNDAPFLWRKRDGTWHAISWAAAAQTVADLATALTALGIRAGDRVMLVSENRPEWCLADLAIMATGAMTVPTYTTNTERDHLHILENSGARAAIVSTPKLAQTLLPAIYHSGQCRHVIGIEPLRQGQASGVDLHDWTALCAAHKGDVAALRATAAGMGRRDLACLIYTSGTGGAPRGVRQHHGMILCNVAGCIEIIDADFPPLPDVFLSFLPLSHAYEHTAGQYLPIALGGQIYYAESLDKLAGNIAEVRPTLMVVVPRLFEVLRQRILKQIEKQGGLSARLFDRALALGEQRIGDGRLPFWARPLDALLDRTVRKRVQDRFGGRLKAMVSGGAPLNPDVGRFFGALGLTILQGYGQTESGPVVSCNRPKASIKMHSVGPPMKGVEVRIAQDGEICVRGELVMSGYWQNPEDSARVLTDDGWLLTGDIGHIDADGHIVITDRKKDIIVNDKGDNVAPQRIEAMLTLQPEILQAMVHGDRRPHLVGLIVPDPEWAAAWAEAQSMDADPAALQANPAFQRAIAAAVDRVNSRLSVVEKVRRISLADAPFTVENEQMTPSLKIRRHVLRQVYGARLDTLYG